MPVRTVHKDDVESETLIFERGKPTDIVMDAKLVKPAPPGKPLKLPDHVTLKQLPKYV